MAGEWRIAVQTCGLERLGRRQVLAELAGRANEETGLIQVSVETLTYDTGLCDRQVRRVIKAMAAERDQGGILEVVKYGKGRGNPSLFRLDVHRIEPLSQDVRIARRVIFAGVGRALQDRKLIGCRLTSDNVFSVFDAMVEAVAAEGHRKEAALIKAQRAVYEAWNTEETDPGPLVDSNVEAETENMTNCQVLEDGEKPDISEGKPDKESLKPDIPSNPPRTPYKELHKTPKLRVREGAQAGKRTALDLLAGEVGVFVFEPSATYQGQVLKTGDTLVIAQPSPFGRRKLAQDRAGLKGLVRSVGCSKWVLVETLDAPEAPKPVGTGKAAA